MSDELRRIWSDVSEWAAVCYRIRDKEKRLRPLRLNHCQQRIESIKREEHAAKGRVRLYVLKARQGGVTTYEQMCNLHRIWSRPGSAVMTLADTSGKTDQIFEISRRAIENFPPALLPRVGDAKTREISFPGLDSHFWTDTAGSKRAGQSITLERLHGSEFATWAHPTATLRAAEPALEKPGTEIVLETTPSMFGSEAHEMWVAAEDGLSEYRAVFLPWWVCDYEYYRTPLTEPDELGKLADDEAALVATHGLDLEQIKWRREKIAAWGQAEFFNKYVEDPATCWLTAGDLFYDPETLKYLLDRAPKVAHRRNVAFDGWHGTFDLFGHQEDPLTKERVVIGADTAEGGGGDRSTYTARTFPTGKLLEQFADATCPPKAFAALLNERGRAHGQAFLVVEKNAHGITVLRELRDTHKYPITRLFHRTVFDQAAKKPTQKIGWATTKESKPLMIDAGRELLNAAKDGQYGMPSAEAVRDAFNVVRDDKGDVSLNGRDVLVAEMLCWLGRSHVGGSYKSIDGFV